MLRCLRFIFVFALALTAAGAFHAAPAAQTFPTPPPVPPTQPVAETKYGTSVTDPYRYFENMKDPVVVDFFKEQNAYARAVLGRLGSAASALFDRIKVLDNAGAIGRGRDARRPLLLLREAQAGRQLAEAVRAQCRRAAPNACWWIRRAWRRRASTIRSTTFFRRSTASTSRTASRKAAPKRRSSTSSRRRRATCCPMRSTAHTTSA